MNIEHFRAYSLSMEGVTEKIPFGKFAKRYDSLIVLYVIVHTCASLIQFILDSVQASWNYVFSKKTF